jgi:hypothetical protein
MGTTVFADTWEWDGTNWTNAGATGPAGRFKHATAYDSGRGQVVLFGGLYQGADLGDTWVWDGTTWTQLFPFTSPAGRHDHAMAYDSARDRVVLFGGYNFADTWEFQGTSDLSIAAQQTVQRPYSGQRATFFVTATGTGPLSYQWRKDAVNVANGLRVAGATSPALTIDAVQGDDAGNYDCIVSNPCGSISSSPVALTLLCYANCDGSTNVPILNINDFICFQGRFAAGCP